MSYLCRSLSLSLCACLRPFIARTILKASCGCASHARNETLCAHLCVCLSVSLCVCVCVCLWWWEGGCTEGPQPTLSLVETYHEHDDAAVAVAVSPVDRTRVATAGWDGMYVHCPCMCPCVYDALCLSLSQVPPAPARLTTECPPPLSLTHTGSINGHWMATWWRAALVRLAPAPQQLLWLPRPPQPMPKWEVRLRLPCASTRATCAPSSTTSTGARQTPTCSPQSDR
jgi:hypothetical protein